MSGDPMGVLDIPGIPESAGAARKWLYEVLVADHSCIAEDAALLTSELIANAIRHSYSGLPINEGQPGRVTVIVLALAAGVRIEVIDAGSNSEPRLVDVGPGATSGRGLHMVAELSARWGSEIIDDEHRKVWFELRPRRQRAGAVICA